MTGNNRLTQKQKRLLPCLLQAHSVKEAAQLAGICERSAWRMLALPSVQGELSRVQDGMLSQVAAGLVADMGVARAVLLDVLRAPVVKDTDRIRAAGMVLDAGLRLCEFAVLTKRLERLELLIGGEGENRG